MGKIKRRDQLNWSCLSSRSDVPKGFIVQVTQCPRSLLFQKVLNATITTAIQALRMLELNSPFLPKALKLNHFKLLTSTPVPRLFFFGCSLCCSVSCLPVILQITLLGSDLILQQNTLWDRHRLAPRRPWRATVLGGSQTLGIGGGFRRMNTMYNPISIYLSLSSLGLSWHCLCLL